MFSLKRSDCHKKTIKSLGIIMDAGLTWEAHVNALCNKLSSQVFVLRQLRYSVSLYVLKTAYYGLIHSSINYGILVWGHSVHINKVFSVQRKCVRVLAGLKYRDDCREQYKKLQIMTVPCMYIFAAVLFIKENEFNYNSAEHQYNTRNKNAYIHHQLSQAEEQ